MNTAVHEIGHLVGLDHSLEPGATMEATAALGEIQKRDLSEDDLAGLCDMYPAGEGPVTCPPARPLEECGEAPVRDDGGAPIACGCGASGGAADAGLVAAAAVLLGLRRRRRA
jgi:MYXO-CTERM domain-containing protein